MRDRFELDWLPLLGEPFRDACIALENQAGQSGNFIKKLAGYRLDLNKLTILGRLIRAYQKNGASLSPLQPLSLGLVSNANVELFEEPLVASAARYGISLTVHSASLGQGFQQGLDPMSCINIAKPDIVLIAFDYRAFFSSEVSSLPGLKITAEEIADQLFQLADSFRRHSNSTIMMATFACPPGSLFGNFDRRQDNSLRNTLNKVNEILVAGLPKGDLIFDVESLAAGVGGLNWFDIRQWNHGKLPFSLRCLPLFSDHIARLLAAFIGKSKKCLVLDLDNTLWGGVVGDDGVQGIELGNGSPIGEAFLDFQRYILALRDRGIILAVCSKNDELVAKEAFNMHSECLLKASDFSAFFANWDDKPNNLRRIAEQLNIGLDAIVFFDDNPFERNIVRKYLPEVAVLEVPSDPSQYREALSRSGWFEAISFSDDDRKRNDQYKENAVRMQAASATDLDSYLKSLDMQLRAEPFHLNNRQRITQLINKTNQFNLTTRRYNEHQVEGFEKTLSGYKRSFRLTDNFGDNGIIGIIICNEHLQGRWMIDTFLMSCRVFNRQVELAMLHHLISQALKDGIKYLDGIYIPSGRNAMVSDVFEKLGFSLDVSKEFEGETRWTLYLEDFVSKKFYIDIIEV